MNLLDLCGEAVSLGVACRKRAKFRVDLDRGHSRAVDAREKTKPRDADACACVQHMIAGTRGNRGGEEHGIASGPVSTARLDYADAATEEVVRGCAFPPRFSFFRRRR